MRPRTCSRGVQGAANLAARNRCQGGQHENLTPSRYHAPAAASCKRSAQKAFLGSTPAPSLLDQVYAYANVLAEEVSPRSMRVIKRQVYEAMFQTLGQALDTATEEMRASLQCEDFKEGVAHFVEKRAPAFQGR